MKKNIKAALMLLLLLTVITVAGYAQDINEANNTTSATEVDGKPNAPDDVPIDAGLSLLLATGVFYGVKKYRENKRYSEQFGVK
jgi:hypothetical protein